jgi:antirestriction protein ArdC
MSQLITLRPKANLEVNTIWINGEQTTLRAALQANPLLVDQLEIRCCDDILTINALAAARVDACNCHSLTSISAPHARLVYVTPHRGVAISAPTNLVSRKKYRGINTLVLWISARAKGYADQTWATYRQWAEAGAQVRKGERATQIVFWDVRPVRGGEQDQPPADPADDKESRRIIAKSYSVFNASQVDGWEAPPAPELPPPNERIAHADNFFAALSIDLRHGGNRAFFSPGGDYIQMPDFRAFTDPLAYYSVLGHETVHWSGGKARLDRNRHEKYADEAYAFEELIAELGSAFLNADLMLSPAPRPDHAPYIQSWLRVLRNDKRAIFSAAAAAQRAVDYLQQLVQPRALKETDDPGPLAQLDEAA